MSFLHPCEMGFVGLVRSRGVVISEAKAPPPVSRAFFRLQRTLMAQVAASTDMQGLAAAGFQAYIRAYAALPAAMREIFHFKKLHLGHVAHSFGLRKQPSKLAQTYGKQLVKTRMQDARDGPRGGRRAERTRKQQPKRRK